MTSKPFETWPRVGSQWPSFNIESSQARGLAAWWPMLASRNTTGLIRDIGSGRFPMTQFNSPAWVNDSEFGPVLLFDDGNSEYLEVSSTPVVTTPITLSCWVLFDDAGGISTPISVQDSAGNSWHSIQNIGTNVRVHTRAAGSSTVAQTTAIFAVNTWINVCGVFPSPTERSIYLTGENKITDTTSKSPIGLDSVSIGRLGDASPSNYLSGQISDVRIYNYALTDAEVFALWDPETRYELHQTPKRRFISIPAILRRIFITHT